MKILHFNKNVEVIYPLYIFLNLVQNQGENHFDEIRYGKRHC